ncbi:MAG: hypothetical protein L0H38_02920, partial [bacterium]|nr:hypothetical protein [bacterium]
TAYVGPSAMVFGSARVYDSARAHGNARVYDNARVYGDARVSTAQVCHYTKLSGSDHVDKGYRGDSVDNNLIRVDDRTYRLKGIELDGRGRYMV